MSVISFGSINKDIVYRVNHLVLPGETISALSVTESMGGKGANQAVAARKAGSEVFMAGRTGGDGVSVIEELLRLGINTDNVVVSDGPSGHAIIQVSDDGENSIILYHGENMNIGREDIDSTLRKFGPGDIIILQNEINDCAYIAEKARERGIKICFNPAPFSEDVKEFPIHSVSVLVVNETEGAALASVVTSDNVEVLTKLREIYPEPIIVLTEGRNGSLCHTGKEIIHQDIFEFGTVDTTAAGDTFIGFFVSAMERGMGIRECMEVSSAASGIACSEKGALQSIPTWDEVAGFIR